MAELFNITAGVLTVIKITTKIISKWKHLIETTRDALKDLRHIFVEISSLKAVFESLQFLSDTDTDFSDAIQNLTSTTGAVKGCRDTVEQLAQELSSPPVYLDSYSGTGKRQRLKGSFQWCLIEDHARKLVQQVSQHKTTITLTLVSEAT